MGRVYAALLHYPIKDRDGQPVTTAVTNLDVHDIARSARTYGLAGYFVVTPIEAQRRLVENIVDHWRVGSGGARIPDRKEALSLVALAASLEDALAEVRAREGRAPRVVATAAHPPDGVVTTPHTEERRTLAATEVPTVLVFGTGYGLTESVLRDADGVLAPLQGAGDYNHLSVRAAAAIYFDRLLGVSP